MNELGVFPVVTEAVQQELRLAEAALAPHPSLPPTPLLMRLCEVLRHQVCALQERP
jgi:octaprenyl-diphosphate synthase